MGKQPKTEKPKILLVEDDELTVRAYTHGLERADFEVLSARDGDAASVLLKTEKPDLILLDMILPEKDGFELLEEMKADERLKDVPVIILSNLGQASDIEQGRKLGAVDYLVKATVTMKEVVERVKFHLS